MTLSVLNIKICNILLSILILEIFLQITSSSENIARGKSANQSTVLIEFNSFVYKANAHVAVDGCLTQRCKCVVDSNGICPLPGHTCCSHTNLNMDTAWWTVDLAIISEIQSIILYTRNAEFGWNFPAMRLSGYKIFASNTTNFTNGVPCEENRDPKVNGEVIYNKCTALARYVTIFNTRNDNKTHSSTRDAVLVLCEVQVIGCPIGKYGDGHCNNECPADCERNRCHPYTGQCYQVIQVSNIWRSVTKQKDRLFTNPDRTETDIRSLIECFITCVKNLSQTVSAVYQVGTKMCYCYIRDYERETIYYTPIPGATFFIRKLQ